jgi:hypothetical protein
LVTAQTASHIDRENIRTNHRFTIALAAAGVLLFAGCSSEASSAVEAAALDSIAPHIELIADSIYVAVDNVDGPYEVGLDPVGSLELVVPCPENSTFYVVADNADGRTVMEVVR